MKALYFAILLTAVVASPTGLAETADRKQPVNIEADRLVVDDRNKIHTFEGKVVLTQGSLTIKGDKLVVTQSADGFQKGIATADSGLASFRQKRDGRSEYIYGEAERIEYDSRTEKARLFNRAKVTSGGDEIRGHFIEYDARTESYRVTNSASGAQDRVRATIQPRNDN